MNLNIYDEIGFFVKFFVFKLIKWNFYKLICGLNFWEKVGKKYVYCIYKI